MNIYILDILKIMALVGFLLIYSFSILQSLPLNLSFVKCHFQVGMASKPLHVRRLQKALQEWVQNPGEFSFLFKIRLSFPFFHVSVVKKDPICILQLPMIEYIVVKDNDRFHQTQCQREPKISVCGFARLPCVLHTAGCLELFLTQPSYLSGSPTV